MDITNRVMGLVCAAYVAMGIPSASNYFAAMVPFLMLVAGLGLVQLRQLVLAQWPAWQRRAGVLTAALVVPLLVAEVTPIVARVQTHPEPRYWTYRRTGEWLASETPQGASIGLVEIGIVGYYSKRRIIDVCGLITPAVGPHLASGDVAWPLRTLRPDYVLLHDPVWPLLEGPVAAATWFRENYEQVRKFDGVEPYKLVLYRRR